VRDDSVRAVSALASRAIASAVADAGRHADRTASSHRRRRRDGSGGRNPCRRARRHAGRSRPALARPDEQLSARAAGLQARAAVEGARGGSRRRGRRAGRGLPRRPPRALRARTRLAVRRRQHARDRRRQHGAAPRGPLQAAQAHAGRRRDPRRLRRPRRPTSPRPSDRAARGRGDARGPAAAARRQARRIKRRNGGLNGARSAGYRCANAEVSMSRIYKQDSWSLSKWSLNEQEILIRMRDALPSAADRELYSNLILVSWTYSTGPSGLPTADTAQLMQDFENAIESAPETKGLGVLAACITGKGRKEWRYYTSDKDEFMAQFNSGLKSHPAYPI